MDESAVQAMAWADDAYEAQLASFTDEHAKGYVERVRATFKKLLECAKSDEGWTKSDEKEGVCVMTRKGEEGVSIVKGRGSIAYSPEEIKNFLWEIDEEMKYDKDKAEGKIIEKFPPLDVMVGYASYNGKLIVSGRDFVYAIGAVRNEDGEIAIASGSTEHDAMPPRKGVVRGYTSVGGWLLSPSKTESGSSECVYLNHTNFKGSLPKMITNSVMASQGFRILTIRAAMLAKYGKKT